MKLILFYYKTNFNYKKTILLLLLPYALSLIGIFCIDINIVWIFKIFIDLQIKL